MSTTLRSTVLVIGATSGIGRGLAERFHASGNKVIACGRRQDRLDALANENKGMHVHRFDLANIEDIEEHLQAIFKLHPDIANVVVAAGIQTYGSFKKGSAPSMLETKQEINTNLVGPLAVSHFVVPRLLKDKDRPASLVFVGSGLGFAPLSGMTSYCASKAALHSVAVSLRGDLAGTNIRVIEIIPPYVDTELGAGHVSQMMADLGDLAKHHVPLKLNAFLDETMKSLEQGVEEIAIGTAVPRATAWRSAFQPFLDRLGSKG